MSRLTPLDDPGALRRTFALFPSGVAAIAAEVDGVPRVLVASSFQVGISADPPLVLFAVQRTSTTWPVLGRAARLGVSVLGEVHEAAARQLASKVVDRFSGIGVERTASGAILIEGAPVHLECAVEGGMPAGDHDVVLLRVHALATDPAAEPLVFHQSTFRRLSPAGIAA
ncbi:flavin reductase family protein [uncultured Amnibacterium sp.]|uniref:flavin reductase family protein n=1 Tax=uncultured Amnibacterium sp. TaxID=1631851 RepID=UPI0035CA8CCE